MADITALENRIRSYIKTNGNQEITGAVAQQILLDIADSLNTIIEAEATARQQAIENKSHDDRQYAENTFDDLNLVDVAGSSLQPTQVTLCLRKNDGTAQEPEWRTLTEMVLPSATTLRAGLMSAEDKQKLNSFVQTINGELDDLNLVDVAGSSLQPTQITLCLRKNDGTEQEPDWRTLTEMVLPSATTLRAGLMSAEDKSRINRVVNDIYKYNNVGNLTQVSLQFFPDNLILAEATATERVYYKQLSAGEYKITASDDSVRQLYLGYTTQVPAEGVQVTLLDSYNSSNIDSIFTLPTDCYLVICRRYNRFTNCSIYSLTPFGSLNLSDITDSSLQPVQITLCLRKNNGTDENPNWQTVTEVILPSATTLKAGLMSAEDKLILNNIFSSLYRYVDVGNLIEQSLQFFPDNLVLAEATATERVYYKQLSAGEYKLVASGGAQRQLYLGYTAQAPAEGVLVTLLASFQADTIDYNFSLPTDCYLVICRRYNRFTDSSVKKLLSKLEIDEAQIQNNTEDIENIKNSIDKSSQTFDIMNKVARDFTTKVAYDSTDYSYTLMQASQSIPTDYSKQHPSPIHLEWTNPDNLAKTLKVADNDNFENAFTFNIDGTSESFDLYNLCPEKTYYIKLSSTSNIILSGKIDVIGERRFLNIDGVNNVRDLGGLKTADKHTVAFEKIIRGGLLNNITTQGKSQIKELVGVNAEIDLRPTPAASSPLGNDVVFDAIPIVEAYDAIVTTDFTGNAPCRQVFKALLRNLNNSKKTYIHCSGGADRTGTISLLLLALCGVSESEVVKDYELTTYSGSNRYRNLAAFTPLITNIKLRQGNSFQEKVRNWWLENDGTYVITEQELDSFINLMTD